MEWHTQECIGGTRSALESHTVHWWHTQGCIGGTCSILVAQSAFTALVIHHPRRNFNSCRSYHPNEYLGPNSWYFEPCLPLTMLGRHNATVLSVLVVGNKDKSNRVLCDVAPLVEESFRIQTNIKMTLEVQYLLHLQCVLWPVDCVTTRLTQVFTWFTTRFTTCFKLLANTAH